ncbi:MAG: putative porin [Planctomycetes bacterium]|nr:putative porin [Planctomycetota bacterium]
MRIKLTFMTVMAVWSVWALPSPALAQSVDEQLRELKAKVDNLEKSAADEKSRRMASEAKLAGMEKASHGQKLSSMQQEEIVKVVTDMLDSVKEESAQPNWLKDLTFSGDFRIRYFAQWWNHNSPGPLFAGGTLPPGMASDSYEGKARSRNQLYYRLRFGFTKTWSDSDLGDFEVGFRLASGSNNDPTGADQALGEISANEPGFAKRPIWIDLAYAKYSPKWFKGLSVTAGKMYNPLQAPTLPCTLTSDLIWVCDVNPEGLWAQYNLKDAIMGGAIEPFVGAGMFIVSDVDQYATYWRPPGGVWRPGGVSTSAVADTASGDTLMWVLTSGLHYRINPDTLWTFAATYYKWQNADNYLASNVNSAASPYTTTAGTLNATAWRGNYAPTGENFGIVNLFTKLDFKLPITSQYKLPVQLFFEWAYNGASAYDENDWRIQPYNFNLYGGTSPGDLYGLTWAGAADTKYRNANNALAAGIIVGQNIKKSDWSISYEYKHVEANAVPGFWGDGDFGYTNRKGHIIAATYNLTDSLTIGGTMFLTDPIVSRPVVNNYGDANNVATSGERSYYVFELDLVWKF